MRDANLERYDQFMQGIRRDNTTAALFQEPFIQNTSLEERLAAIERGCAEYDARQASKDDAHPNNRLYEGTSDGRVEEIVDRLRRSLHESPGSITRWSALGEEAFREFPWLGNLSVDLNLEHPGMVFVGNANSLKRVKAYLRYQVMKVLAPHCNYAGQAIK